MLRSLGWGRHNSGKNSKQNNSTGVMRKQGVPEPLCTSLGCFSELGKLSYLIWKRRVWAICWSKNFEFFQSKSYYLSIFLSSAGLLQVTFTFCSTTHLFPRGKKATIPHFNQHIQGFHMTPIAWIFFGEISLLWPQCHLWKISPRTPRHDQRISKPKTLV